MIGIKNEETQCEHQMCVTKTSTHCMHALPIIYTAFKRNGNGSFNHFDFLMQKFILLRIG